MTREKLREEIAWRLAVLAARLLCLVLLPFYPQAWGAWKLDDLLRWL